MKRAKNPHINRGILHFQFIHIFIISVLTLMGQLWKFRYKFVLINYIGCLNSFSRDALSLARICSRTLACVAVILSEGCRKKRHPSKIPSSTAYNKRTRRSIVSRFSVYARCIMAQIHAKSRLDPAPWPEPTNCPFNGDPAFLWLEPVSSVVSFHFPIANSEVKLNWVL